MRGDGWQVSEKVDRHLNQFKTEEKLENSVIYMYEVGWQVLQWLTGKILNKMQHMLIISVYTWEGMVDK